MKGLIAALEWFFILYFVALYAGPIALNLLAIPALRRRIALRPLASLPPAYSGFELPVSLLVPAFDEEADIASRVRSLLELDYPEFEIVVVNDGSRDGTLAALQEAFELEVFPEAHWRRIPAKPVRTIYHSRRHANLRVVDKEHGGKADALNAGINASRYPLFCAMDAGWILQRDSLRRVIEPFVDDPSTVASIAVPRIANDSTVSARRLERVELSTRPLVLLQTVESLRTLFAQLGWATLNAVLVVAGGFSVLRKDAVVEAGGYRAGTPGEDMELLPRLHRVLRARGERYAIHVVPDPVCWTRAPESIGALEAQRARWQRGLCDSLHRNAGPLRGGGAAGLLAYAFLMVFECYGPFVEAAAYAFMAAMWMTGQISGIGFAAFLALAFSLGFLLSVSALLLEDISFRLYPRFSQMGLLAAAAIAENLGYRQLVTVWRLVALARWRRARGRAR